MKNIIILLLILSFFQSCTKTTIEEKTIFDTTVVIRRDTLMTGTISATVLFEGEKSTLSYLPLTPYRGLKVTVSNSQAKIVATDTTDYAGYFSISNIPIGEYAVKFAGEKYEETFNVQVENGKTTQIKNYFFDCLFLPNERVNKKRWTFIHYACLADMTMSVDINFMWDFRILERDGGSSENINQILYIPATSHQSIRSQLRYLTKPNIAIENEKPYEIGFDTPFLFSSAYNFDAHTFTDRDPADYNHFKNSVHQISKLFPSDSVVLFFYDHGTGIDISFPNPDTRSIGGNVATQREITVPQIRKSLEYLKDNGVKVHSLVMVACLMGAYEIAYELKDCGLQYILASEKQSSGGTYIKGADWVDKLNNDQMTVPQALSQIVNDQKIGNNFALYDMSRLGELTTLFNDFAKKMSLTDASLLKPAVEKSLKAGGGAPVDIEHSCYDLGDFAKNVSETTFEDIHSLRSSALKLYQFLRTKKSGNFITAFNNLNDNKEFQERSVGIGVLLRSPEHPYAGHHQDVYRQHKYYSDGNIDWDKFLMNLDKLQW